MNKKYMNEQDQLIYKQLLKISRAVNKLLNTRSGGAKNYDKYNNVVDPLREFNSIMSKFERGVKNDK